VDAVWPFGSGVEAGGKVSADWLLLTWLLFHLGFCLWVAHETSEALKFLFGHVFETFVGSCSPGGCGVGVNELHDGLAFSKSFSEGFSDVETELFPVG